MYISYTFHLSIFTRKQLKLMSQMTLNQRHRIFLKSEKSRKSKYLRTHLSHERIVDVSKKVGLKNLIGSNIPLNVMRFFATIAANIPHRL